MVLVGRTVLAQSRSHDQIMKDVNATFGALDKDLGSNSATAVQEDAAKLSGLFKEVEVFWSPLRSKPRWSPQRPYKRPRRRSRRPQRRMI